MSQGLTGAVSGAAARAASTPSAATITLPAAPLSATYPISGTVTITSITAGQVGAVARLEFASAGCQVTSGSNLKLAGNYTSTVLGTLTLVSDGTNWVEFGRSPTPSTAVASDQAFGDAATSGAVGLPADIGHRHGMPTLVRPLTNPGREIWQLGTSFAAMADLAYGPDRWQWNKAGTDAMTIAQEGTTKQPNSQFAMKCTFTLGTGAGASRVRQDLKMTDGYQFLLGQPFSYADDVKLNSGVASAVRAFVQTDGTGGTTTFSGYHGNNPNWETLAVENVTIPTDATFVRVGLTFEATVTLFADNARAAVGTRAPAFSGMHPADELARCQRYVVVVSNTVNEPVGAGFAYSTTHALASVRFPVEMGGIPTMTYTTPASFLVLTSIANGQALSAMVTNLSSARGVFIDCTASAAVLVAGNGTVVQQTGVGSIIAVWNP